MRVGAGAALAAGASAGCARRAWEGNRGILELRPAIDGGVASGDVTRDGAIVWSRADRPATMLVEWATTESFKDARAVRGPDATPATGFTARVDLRGLPAGQRVFYRVRFADLSDPSLVSEPAVGSFATPGDAKADVLFAWSGDTAGQGWGINPEFGGMRAYAAMLATAPQFMIHSGDTIYADIPLKPAVTLPDGTTWRNVMTPAKSKVAQTLDDFRGNHAYNLLDEHVRRFNAAVPVIAQWDDHEVRNNWCPGQVIPASDAAYTLERSLDVLAGRARQAFLEFMPIRPTPADAGRIYRQCGRGPLLDVFLLDERSYRARNTRNRQAEAGPETAFLGRAQLDWLKRGLATSTATWKVIASDMPVTLVAGDGENFEAAANGDDGAPLGRELEFAELLAFMKQSGVRNTVWLTADVHYATAIHCDPARAATFKDFDPFWEFVSGPLNAGTFGPNKVDKTFGAEVRWHSLPPGFKGGPGPSAGLQFFGTVGIDAKTGALTVSQYNMKGERIYRNELEPVREA